MTKKLFQISFCLIFVTSVYSLVFPLPVRAQIVTAVQCGQSYDSVFTGNNEVHEYSVDIVEGTRIILFAEEKANAYQELVIDIGLTSPSHYVINELSDDADDIGNAKYWEIGWPTYTVDTDPVAETGPYSIFVKGYTDTGSAYSLSISCIYSDGTVVSPNSLVTSVTCGSIIENQFSRNNEIHRYYLNLNSNDIALISAVSMSNAYQELIMDAGMSAPGGYVIDKLSKDADDIGNAKYWEMGWPTYNVDTGPVVETGTYRLYVKGYTDTGSAYTLSIGCTLADGTQIRPGDAPTPTSPPTLPANSEQPCTPFSGFGFPGLAPVDFSSATTLPLPEGIPLSGIMTPDDSEVIGFKLNANAGQVLDLSFSRLSGNLNLGIAVISATNEVVFQVSLVTSMSFSTQIALPSTGEYTIGVYRIDLLPLPAPEATAFQVQMQLE